MNNISPIGGRPSIAAGQSSRASKAILTDKTKAPNETVNGERNARATEAAANRKAANAPTTSQDGRGGNLDIVS